MSKIDVSIQVDADAVGKTEQVHQYGLQLPNEAVKWDTFYYAGSKQCIQHATTSPSIRKDLILYLNGKADAANIPRDAYINGHKIVKRLVTIVVSAVEEHGEVREETHST